MNHYRFPDTWLGVDWGRSYANAWADNGVRAGEISRRKRNKQRAKMARQSQRINRRKQ